MKRIHGRCNISLHRGYLTSLGLLSLISIKPTRNEGVSNVQRLEDHVYHHAIVALIFGLLLYLQPGCGQNGQLAHSTDPDPSLWSCLLALAVSSWFGYRAARWMKSGSCPDGDRLDSAEHHRGLWGLLFRGAQRLVGQRIHLDGFCRGVDLLLRQSAGQA